MPDRRLHPPPSATLLEAVIMPVMAPHGQRGRLRQPSANGTSGGNWNSTMDDHDDDADYAGLPARAEFPKTAPQEAPSVPAPEAEPIPSAGEVIIARPSRRSTRPIVSAATSDRRGPHPRSTAGPSRTLDAGRPVPPPAARAPSPRPPGGRLTLFNGDFAGGSPQIRGRPHERTGGRKFRCRALRRTAPSLRNSRALPAPSTRL